MLRKVKIELTKRSTVCSANRKLLDETKTAVSIVKDFANCCILRELIVVGDRLQVKLSEIADTCLMVRHRIIDIFRWNPVQSVLHKSAGSKIKDLLESACLYAVWTRPDKVVARPENVAKKLQCVKSSISNFAVIQITASEIKIFYLPFAFPRRFCTEN